MTKEETIKNIVREYTHDRSESGYDDILGACPDNCYQCKKDERFIQKLIKFKQQVREDEREKLLWEVTEKWNETVAEVGIEVAEQNLIDEFKQFLIKKYKTLSQPKENKEE